MEKFFNAVLGLILIGFLVGSQSIPVKEVNSDIVGASGFPAIFSIIGLFLLLGIVLQDYYKNKNRKDENKKDKIIVNKEKLIRLFTVIILLILYTALVEKLGFVIINLIFVFFCIRTLGSKKWKFNLLFSVILTTVLLIIFGKIFVVSLPRGIGILRELSFYLY